MRRGYKSRLVTWERRGAQGRTLNPSLTPRHFLVVLHDSQPLFVFMQQEVEL